MEWWRSWHGAPTDLKWMVVARKANVSPVFVAGVAWALMDYASQNEVRGSIEGFDIESYSGFAGVDESEIEAVISAMKSIKKPLIIDNQLVAWTKRQPKREDDSRERVAAYRDRQREERYEDDVTHGNAEKRTVTKSNSRTDRTDTDIKGAKKSNGTKAQPKREDQAIWDQFTTKLEYEPDTSGERGKWNDGIKQLRNANVKPTDVPTLIDGYFQRYGINTECNPKALAQNLGSVRNAMKKSREPTQTKRNYVPADKWDDYLEGKWQPS